MLYHLSGAARTSSSNDDALIQDRLGAVKHKILVLSGKGGVGVYEIDRSLTC